MFDAVYFCFRVYVVSCFVFGVVSYDADVEVWRFALLRGGDFEFDDGVRGIFAYDGGLSLVGADSPHGVSTLEVLVLFGERCKVYLKVYALVGVVGHGRGWCDVCPPYVPVLKVGQFEVVFAAEHGFYVVLVGCESHHDLFDPEAAWDVDGHGMILLFFEGFEDLGVVVVVNGSGKWWILRTQDLRKSIQ